ATRIFPYITHLRGACDAGDRPDAGRSCSASCTFGSRWCGRNQILAINVGTTALAITAATNAEYCAWLTIPCDSPNSDEMVPKVRPVDINSVVYIPSLEGDRNARVTG